MAKIVNDVGRWAIINNGIVENVVMWDGKGDIFKNFTTYKLPSDSPVGVGYLVNGDSADEYEFIAPEVKQL